MANHFPSAPSLALAELHYAVNITSITGVGGVVFPAGVLNLIYVSFVTGITGGMVTFDYTLFDQDANEATIATMLTTLATTMATGLGVTTATVQAAITVTRSWVFTPVVQATSPAQTYTTTDQMAYP